MAGVQARCNQGRSRRFQEGGHLPRLDPRGLSSSVAFARECKYEPLPSTFRVYFLLVGYISRKYNCTRNVRVHRIPKVTGRPCDVCTPLKIRGLGKIGLDGCAT